MTEPKRPRLTRFGSDALEVALDRRLQSITTVARAIIPSQEIVALVVIGSYGRGEGGIERTGALERPHNNIDVLLVTRRRRPRALAHTLSHALESTRPEGAVPVDVGLASRAELLSSRSKVMWHDMLYGHRTLLGDASFVPSLRHLARPPARAEFRHLLTNRGTLLLLDDETPSRGAAEAEGTRRALRHAVKAVIGYGDAWLSTRGAYHGSYSEKRRRMAESKDAPAWLRELYDEAVAFRFEADYAHAASSSLRQRIKDNSDRLASLHLEIERFCLGRPSLSWDRHLSAALRAPLSNPPRSAREFAARLRNFACSRALGAKVGEGVALGARLASGRELLAATFPIVAYDIAPSQRADVARLLGCLDAERDSLRRAYLERWGRDGDVNFKP